MAGANAHLMLIYNFHQIGENWLRIGWELSESWNSFLLGHVTFTSLNWRVAILPSKCKKVASTYRNFHIIIATIQTIEYWIRRSQFHLSYVNNVSDTMACLTTTFLMWYQAICGEFCSYRQLPTHLTRLGRHQWTPCFVLMAPYWGLICIEWRHTPADWWNRSDHQ